MNEVRERVETDLLTIIKEGQNLAEGYVEVRPGIRVKAGREREFERLCDNYYELEFNQRIENNTDTVTPVYESLIKLIETENEEFYISKAADYVSETKSEVERFKNLVRSYNTVDNAYKLTVKNLNDLYLKRESTTEWQNRVTELNNEVARLTENTAILTEQINIARRNVNTTLIKYVEEQMKTIRDNFTSTTRDTDRAQTLDHNFVLANDQLEYDSLYRLSLLLKHANEIEDFDKFVVLDDAMIVTEEQRDILTSTVLPNIKLYGYIKAPEKKPVNVTRNTNNTFIEEIEKALAKLDEMSKKDATASDVIEEKEKLLAILGILRKANTGRGEAKPIWNKAYVDVEDQPTFIQIANSSRLLRRLNPELAGDINRREENAELINKLYAYLDDMADKVRGYKGVANLPIKSTNTIGDRAWVVNERDEKEANRIIEIIKLLQKQEDDLIPVWGANVNASYMAQFKRLANATVYFSGKIPEITENEAEIEKVREQLRDLIARAKGADKSLLATNGLVLASEYELYKLLEEKFGYLDAAKASDNLVPIDGVLIDDRYIVKYQGVNQKITMLLNAQTEVKKDEPVQGSSTPISGIPSETTSTNEKIDFSKNNRNIEVLKGYLKTLNAILSLNELEKELFDLASECIEILARAKSSKKVIDVNGWKFAGDDDKERFAVISDRIHEVIDILNKAESNSYKPIDLDKALVPVGYFGSSISSSTSSTESIDFSDNDKKIAELKAELAKLSAKSSHNELERKMFDLLSEQIELLENAKKSTTVVGDRLKFANESDKDKYLESALDLEGVIKKLNEPTESNKKKTTSETENTPTFEEGDIDFSINDAKIAELREEMAKLEPTRKKDELAGTIYELLRKQIAILENAKDSEKVIDMQGLKFASAEDQIEYLTAQSSLDDILEDLNKNDNNDNDKKKGKFRKKIIAIRDHIGEKLGGFRVGEFIVKHKDFIRLLAVIGIGTIAVSYFLPQIISAVVFSCHCNAAAMPWAAPFFNGVVTALDSAGKVSKIGVSASQAGPAFVRAIAKLGMVSLGGYGALKGVSMINNLGNEEQLSDSEKRSIIQKLTDLIEELKKQIQRGMVNIYISSEEFLSRFGKKKDEETVDEVQEQIGDEVLAISDGKDGVSDNVPNIISTSSSETPESEMTEQQTEELKKRKALGEEIIKKQTAAKEALKKREAERIAMEEERDAEQKRLIEENAIITTNGSVSVTSSSEIPVVEVPSTDEVISHLGENGTEDPELLDVKPTDAPTSGVKTPHVLNLLNTGNTQNTQDVIEKIVNEGPNVEEIEAQIAAKENEILTFQGMLERTTSNELKIAYQNHIDTLNKEIEALREQARGR